MNALWWMLKKIGIAFLAFRMKPNPINLIILVIAAIIPGLVMALVEFLAGPFIAIFSGDKLKNQLVEFSEVLGNAVCGIILYIVIWNLIF